LITTASSASADHCSVVGVLPGRGNPDSLDLERQLYNVCADTPASLATGVNAIFNEGNNLFRITALRSLE
jgi:hypothetical protein